MTSWLESMFGEGSASAAMWIVLAVIILFVLLVALRLVKTLRSGTFIAGGRNRAPRLAVVDAAAVDAQRRLVLVRRDNVEHLILIGGPSDLVIEPGIRAEERERALASRQLKNDRTPPSPPAAKAAEPGRTQQRQPSATAPIPPAAQANPPSTSSNAAQRSAPSAAETRNAQAAPRRHTVAVTPTELSDAPEPEAPAPVLHAVAPVAPPSSPRDQSGQSNTAEIVSLDVVPSRTVAPDAGKPLETSLEEEMGRLLEDISLEETRRS